MVSGGLMLLSGVWLYAGESEKEKVSIKKDEVQRALDLATADGVLTPAEEKRVRELADRHGLDPSELVNRAKQMILERDGPAETELIDQIKRSGDDFEKYMVGKFNRDYFHLVEWAGDKVSEGRYAESTLNPDLVLELDLEFGGKHRLAVECKYRSSDKNGFLNICTDNQLSRYKAYKQRTGAPTFIALGLGGKPSRPERLFVIPIHRIKYASSTLGFLSEFEVDIDRNFYFDYEHGTLSTERHSKNK